MVSSHACEYYYKPKIHKKQKKSQGIKCKAIQHVTPGILQAMERKELLLFTTWLNLTGILSKTEYERVYTLSVSIYIKLKSTVTYSCKLE